MKDLSELIKENIPEKCIWDDNGRLVLDNIPVIELLNLLDAYTREKIAPVIEAMEKDINQYQAINLGCSDVKSLMGSYLIWLSNIRRPDDTIQGQHRA